MLLIGAIVSTGCVSVCAYYFILGYFFTGTDTITLIETSRIHSFKDFARLFAEPLMAGSKFVDIAKFFRPVATLSYTFDYTVWSLNPFGYQLTNLLLNSMVACLIVVVMYQLSKGNTLFAWLSGVIFAIHPVLVESVPATDRRHDIIAAVFLLLSISFFLKCAVTDTGKRWLIFFSLLFYVSALGSKETAIILPALIFVQIYIYSNSPSRSRRFFLGMKVTAPYLVLTISYLAWRTLVLGGLGGYSRSVPLEFDEICDYVVNIFHNYIIDLIYPADPLGVLNCCYANWWTLVALTFFCAYIGLYLLGFTFSKDSSYRRESVNLLLCLAYWLLIPLLLFINTLTFSHRSMYIPTISFSALLAYPLAKTLKSMWATWFKFRSDEEKISIQGPGSKAREFVIAMGCLMFFYLLIYSPLMRNYDQWEASARMGRIILTRLASGTHELTQDYRVNLYNLPECLKSYENKQAKAKEVTYLSDYSIKSWLNMCGFHKNLDVIIHSRSQPWDFSGDLSVAILQLGKKNLRAVVRMKPTTHRNTLVR